MMMRKNVVGMVVLVALVALMSAAAVQAAVSDVVFYGLGEDDPGAASGSIGNDPTVDGVAGVNLTRAGNPTYSAVVEPAPRQKLSSSLSMVFDGDDYYNVGQNVLPATDNYGFEAWVKADVLDGFNFALSAGTNYGGISLVQVGGQWGVLQQGVGWAVPVSTPVAVGQWQHIAAVSNGGTVEMYIDGQLMGSGANTSKPIQASFTVGANDKADGGSAAAGNAVFEGYWKGAIDSVRVFTFEPGQFSAADLNYVPEPVSLSLLGIGAAWIIRRKH